MACHLLSTLAGDPELQLCVLLLNEGRLASELREVVGCSVTVLDEGGRGFVTLLRLVRGHLEQTRPDLIHSHRYKENLLAFLASAGLQARLVATQHGLPEPCGSESLVRSLKASANFFLMRRFFRTVAVSDDIRSQLMTRFGFRGDRVSVVHNGVPVPPCAGPSKKRAAPFSIGSSGRLFHVKDYPLMVEVANLVCRERDVTFRLAGEGPCRQEVLAAVKRHGLEERFTLTGHLDRMEPFYRGLDLYLNTSLHEGIPMTILEAMACGVPVVAPAVGGVGEIIADGVEGCLVQGRDPASFARRCIELIDDAPLRAALSRAAHQKALSMFSVEKMAQDYQRVYRDLLAGPVTE
ncbi:glycosyltransferase family 4 protein [Geomonas agri]|uniref:glycosyltransferase family 4 protein n=1 Tax=Geomonas agri TaxID=2873702 RepID=UPI001CD3C68B|nr:glycosyltransferase family 4 protein [Geomonas agri]